MSLFDRTDGTLPISEPFVSELEAEQFAAKHKLEPLEGYAPDAVVHKVVTPRTRRTFYCVYAKPN